MSDDAANTTRCDDCGVEYAEGEWPYCPHGKPTYQWGTGNAAMRRWTHTGSRSPR